MCHNWAGRLLRGGANAADVQTPPMTMTGSGITDHLPESDMQAFMFTDIFAQIESKFKPNLSDTGLHDPSARIMAISTLDKGIDASRQFLCSLLTHRNALIPISRLPPEILARVFHFLVLRKPPLSGKRDLGWIRVTHVCRQWRQVALEDSTLWAKIWGIPRNKRRILEILARAKNTPLNIRFDDVGESTSETLLTILPHLSRARLLCFHGVSICHSRSLREIFNREAPSLEYFELAGDAYSPVTLRALGENMLFKGHAPMLQAFTLLRVVIPWPLIPRGQLTQLKVTSREKDVHPPGDLNQLIDLLVNCPALEILALRSCLPSQPTDFPHDRTIHLPHLSRLLLCGSASRIMNMLEMFKLPSLTTLHLNCSSKTTHSDSEGLLPVILAHFQNLAPVKFRSLTVSTGRYISGSLYMTASTFPTLRNRQTRNFEDDIAGNAELVLSFNRLSKPTDVVQKACKMLPISNLEFISMSASEMIDLNWVELFGCCTNVTTMQAIGNGTCNFVWALTAPKIINTAPSKRGRKRKRNHVVQPASTVAYAHPAIFPNLKSLEVTDLNFELDFAKNKHEPSGIKFDVFKRGLQQRAEASGERLGLLCVNDCNISFERARDLYDLVQDFYWDRNGSGICVARLHAAGEVVFVNRRALPDDWDLVDWDAEDNTDSEDDMDSEDYSVSESDAWWM